MGCCDDDRDIGPSWKTYLAVFAIAWAIILILHYMGVV